MRKVDLKDILESYPDLSNKDELLNADFLVLPAEHNSFSVGQRFFNEFKDQYDINCKYYSEDQNALYTSFYNLTEIIIDLGTIIASIELILNLYSFLMAKNLNSNIKIKTVVKQGDDYFEMEEFEGSVSGYGEYLKLKTPK